MLQDILIISLWGGMVAMDTTAAMQIMLSRPLVSCTVTGMLLGNLPVGFAMGVLLELIYISELPIGAARFAEGNIGSSAATGAAILTLNAHPERSIIVIAFSMILALLLSAVGGTLVEGMRRINDHLYTSLLNKEKIKSSDVNRTHITGILLAYSVGFLLTFTSVLLFSSLFTVVFANIPEKYDKIFYPIQGGLLAVGTVFVLQLFLRNSKDKWVLLAGAAVGIILLLALKL